MSETRMKKIQALLAKAEGTEHETEAQAFFAKAHELMTEWGIDELVARGYDPTAGDIVTERWDMERPYTAAKINMAYGIVLAHNCEAIRRGDAIVVTGFKSDVRNAQLIFESALITATGEMLRHSNITDGWSGTNRTKSFRASFLQGYGHRLGRRLKEAGKAAVRKHADNDLLPAVLESRKDRVDQAFAELYPNLGAPDRRRVNADGYRAGEAAANRATVNPQVGGSRAAIG